jgi:hypothetical protein
MRQHAKRWQLQQSRIVLSWRSHLLGRKVFREPDGLVCALDSRADPSLRNFWRVNDEIVLVLAQDLRLKAGNAAWGFMLSRDCTPYGPKSYPYDERTKRFVPAVSSSSCKPPNANR